MPANPPHVAVIGAGPAGLMAAEILATAGVRVTVFDQMPSPARKLLIAGRGGLNLTHSEGLEAMLPRYGAARTSLEPALRAFPPEALVAWCEGLGQPTFTGSSGRVFPRALKASPLLRAWLARLDALGVALRPRHRWTGRAEGGALRFATPEGEAQVEAEATVLALGGASWPRLGSDGAWPPLLPGVRTLPFAPSNMGFAVAWSDRFQERFQGEPLKRIALRCGDRHVRGEALVTASGIEGGAVYALSASIRQAIAASGPVVLELDLRPDLDHAALAARLAGRASLSNRLRKAGLPPVSIALVQEAVHAGAARNDPAGLVKRLPLRLLAPQGLDRAISSAGGVALGEVDATLMLRAWPGTFLCGEMLDWEAPTGGYLLQACFATGVAAARGVLGHLRR